MKYGRDVFTSTARKFRTLNISTISKVSCAVIVLRLFLVALLLTWNQVRELGCQFQVNYCELVKWRSFMCALIGLCIPMRTKAKNGFVISTASQEACSEAATTDHESPSLMHFHSTPKNQSEIVVLVFHEYCSLLQKIRHSDFTSL